MTQLHANHIYLYECVDEIKVSTAKGAERLPTIRQRCGKHVETTGPLRLLRVIADYHPPTDRTCIMCEFERVNGRL